jgi:hypothetical protein
VIRLEDSTSLAALKEQLSALPPATRNGVTPREFLDEMADVIRGLRARGYTIDAVATLLRERGVKISARTLRRHLASKRRKTSRQPTSARAVEERSSPAPAPVPVAPKPEKPVVRPPPARGSFQVRTDDGDL